MMNPMNTLQFMSVDDNGPLSRWSKALQDTNTNGRRPEEKAEAVSFATVATTSNDVLYGHETYITTTVFQNYRRQARSLDAR